MLQIFIFILTFHVLLVVIGNVGAFGETLTCGNWIPYKDQKCIKIATKAGHQTQQDAEVVCKTYRDELHTESYPQLITIKSKEEQEFLQQVLFEDIKIVDHVWLGLKMESGSNEMKWNDGSKAYFTNWANLTVADKHECVQMESGAGVIPAGQWSKVNCKKGNIVVCERPPTVTLETLQAMFLSYKVDQDLIFNKTVSSLTQRNDAAEHEITKLMQRNTAAEKEIGGLQQKNTEAEKEFSDLQRRNTVAEKEISGLQQRISALQQRNTASNQEITNLKQNPVPVGFIYAELPGQQPPTTLWPQTKWTDVSTKYAGLFFRVLGGESAALGQVQESASPRLAQVKNAGVDVLPNVNDQIDVPSDGSWSNYVLNGAYKALSEDLLFLNFRVSQTEVRPRNQAMRLWQRTA